ncbi:MAG: AI-2E family transporter [Melioribacteraceae bacterium]|jgi:predicted PurR-regulated permease PerM|nr:AI-2E family transporter [Melioribacteraceae bacterium]RJP58685.1 MAG: AI-2E family transporter [Ignavibacteriales bacterium]WKZ69603.1 MAG: AI-2E family transporter [Melioribacteraceae bacterium]
MKKVFSDPTVKFFISIVGLVVIFTVLRELQHIFIPLVISYFLFFLFEPLNKFLNNKKIPFALAIFANLIIMIGVIWGISRIIIESFSRFGRELNIYEQKLNNIVSTTATSFGIDDPFFIQFSLSEILEGLDYGGIAGTFFSSTLSIFSTTFFVLFFFIFISIGHKNLYEVIKKRFVERHVKDSLKQIKKELKKEEDKKSTNTLDNLKVRREQLIEKTFKDITSQVQRYIATKFMLSLLTGVLSGFILWLFDVDFFIVWAVFAFLLNFIPNIGSAIAVIFPALMTLVQYESLGYALLVTAILVVIQTVIGNGLEPKIFGDRLGLNPLVILLSLLLWGYVWGIVGMFLSVPLTAVAKIIMSNSNSLNLNFMSDLMGN